MASREFMADLAARFGTPLYLYDLAAVRRSAAALRSDLPVGSRLFYSVKANPHPVLIEALRAEGYDAEVSSVGELRVALAAGHHPDRLLYSGPGKSPGAVRTALAGSVRSFSVESVTDRDRLETAAAEARVDCEHVVRLNGPAGSGGGSLRMTGTASAFGVDVTDKHAIDSLFTSRRWTVPSGVHTYFATNVAEEEALIAEFKEAVHTVSEVCAGAGFEPRLVDLGGGFPAPQAEPGPMVRHHHLRAAIEATLDDHIKGWQDRRTEVAFESGRYLVAAAGTLITEVLDVKRSGGRWFTVVDAGVNVLGGMSGLGRLMAPKTNPYKLVPTPETGLSPDSESSVLVGPLCTPLDVLNRSADLEEAQVGDLLAVPNVGAYGLTASLVGFLSHPVPVEVVHDGDTVTSVRKLALVEAEVWP